MRPIINYLKNMCSEISKENISICAILLIGSYARGEERSDSDIDIMIISENKDEMIDDINWIYKYGNVNHYIREEWGAVTSLRVFYDMCECEFSIGHTSWINIPFDEGTKRVLSDGYSILYERSNCLEQVKSFIRERILA